MPNSWTLRPDIPPRSIISMSLGNMRKTSFWCLKRPNFNERNGLVLQLFRPYLWEIHQHPQRKLGPMTFRWSDKDG